MSDYATEIASRIMGDNSPGGAYISLSGDDLRAALTRAAREGYTLGLGVNS